MFRTSSDGAIARQVSGPATFEVDRIDATMGEGWSVLLTGTARLIDDRAEAAELRTAAPIMTWADGERETYVHLSATHVSGRRVRSLRWGEEDTARER